MFNMFCIMHFIHKVKFYKDKVNMPIDNLIKLKPEDFSI